MGEGRGEGKYKSERQRQRERKGKKSKKKMQYGQEANKLLPKNEEVHVGDRSSGI
jgi:hypothetical protein